MLKVIKITDRLLEVAKVKIPHLGAIYDFRLDLATHEILYKDQDSGVFIPIGDIGRYSKGVQDILADVEHAFRKEIG